MRDMISKFDSFVFRVLNKKIKNSVLSCFMYLITQLASGIGVTAITFVFFLIPDIRFKKVSVFLMIALLLNTFIVQVIKKSVGRTRPYETLTDINTYGIKMRDKSFPSGHTVSAITVAMALGYYFPQYSTIFIIVGILISVSRIYLGVHYASDVLFAMIMSFPLVHMELYYLADIINTLF